MQCAFAVLGGVHIKLTKTKHKQNIKKTETRVNLLSSHTHTHTTKRRHLLDVSSPHSANSCSEDTMWRFKENEEDHDEDITHGCCWLYTPRIKNIKRKEAFLGGSNIGIKKKVKCTLVQALRLCTGRTALRGSRGRALLFLDHGTRRR